MLKDFTEAGLKQLIENQVEENLHLDYKAAGSLDKADQKKNEIAKDVSSFANSDGGQIIYGIAEHKDNRHLPGGLSPIDRNEFNKEWLENVIVDRIQPRMGSIIIHPINLSSAASHVAYAIDVPKSSTVHQASDFCYYKRYNFKAVPMEDYEIRDVMNRQDKPLLTFVFEAASLEVKNSEYNFRIIVANNSIRVAKDVKVILSAINPIAIDLYSWDLFNDLSAQNNHIPTFGSKDPLNVYYLLPMHVGTFRFTLGIGHLFQTFKATILCDNMSPVMKFFKVGVINRKLSLEVLPDL